MQTMKMKLGINGGIMGLALLMVAAMALSGCAASSDEADATLANNSAAIVQDDSPPSPPPPPETVAVERNQKVTEDSPERSRTRYREQTRDSSSWTYKKSDKPLPDLTDDKSKQNEPFGEGGGDGTLGHGASRAGSGDGFFGIGAGQAKDIIFVVDRSGSMTDSFMFVKYELIRSISNLEQDLNFHIIFYSSGPGVEMPARKLTSATEANKQKAYDFINGITPEGQTDPSNALDKAFRLEPDVIFLLTDGEFDREIITQINRLNKEKKVTVNTISFLYTMGEMACMKIADQNNGKYRHVDSDWIRNIGGENKKKHGDATANEAAAVADGSKHEETPLELAVPVIKRGTSKLTVSVKSAEDDSPVANAVVMLTMGASGNVNGKTDESGVAVFTDLRTGKCSISVKADHHQRAYDVNLLTRAEERMEFKLTRLFDILVRLAPSNEKRIVGIGTYTENGIHPSMAEVPPGADSCVVKNVMEGEAVLATFNDNVKRVRVGDAEQVTVEPPEARNIQLVKVQRDCVLEVERQAAISTSITFRGATWDDESNVTFYVMDRATMMPALTLAVQHLKNRYPLPKRDYILFVVDISPSGGRRWRKVGELDLTKAEGETADFVFPVPAEGSREYSSKDVDGNRNFGKQ